MSTLWVFIAAGSTAAFLLMMVVYAISVYNNLVQVRNNIEKAWSNIEVLLLQRHEELPKLVDTCRSYMKHEAGVFETITKLREQYGKAQKIEEKVRIENDLNRQIHGLAVNVENYPELKAVQPFLQTQARVSALESSIADRREFFNDTVNIFNTQIDRFPEVIVARLLGFERQAFLDVPEKKKQDVKMDFSS